MLKKCDSGENPENSIVTTRLGAASYNFPNRWHYKFRYMDGGVQGSLTAKSDAARLIYSGNIEEGAIHYRLYDSSGTLIFTFPEENPPDTLSGLFRKGAQYTVRATATRARGEFEFRME
jgi:hypothetical protein